MKITNLTVENFEIEALKEKKPVLVDFWASWCGPCKMLSPIVDEIAEELDQIKVCKVNVDEEGELAQRYRVMSIPTLLLIVDGKVEKTSIGLKSKSELLEMLTIA